MKYFTPELLAQCRSANGDIADRAANDWEKAIGAYNRRLEKIRPQLPLGARQLLRHLSLHDAQCLMIKTAAKGPVKELFLTFRLAGKAAGGVELRYRLVEPPTLQVGKEQRRAEPFTPHVLYDEFDVEGKGSRKAFTHSLLITSGLEFRIKFINLSLRRFGSVLPASSTPADIQKELAEDNWMATA